MKTRFGATTQPHIGKIWLKKTRVLELLMFYETRKNSNFFWKCWVVSFIQLSVIMSVLII